MRRGVAVTAGKGALKVQLKSQVCGAIVGSHAPLEDSERDVLLQDHICMCASIVSVCMHGGWALHGSGFPWPD